MELKKVWHDKRVDFGIYRKRKDGYVDSWFYNEAFSSREAAQKFIDERGPSYSGDLFIVAHYRKAGYAYEGNFCF